MSFTDGQTKKYNHVSTIGFVQTGIYRVSTRDISGESYIIRKWQKRVPRGPLKKISPHMYFHNGTECFRNDWKNLEITGNAEIIWKEPYNYCKFPNVAGMWQVRAKNTKNRWKWLELAGYGWTLLNKFLEDLRMCKILMLVLWPEKCQRDVTWGFCSQTGMCS